MAPPPHLQAVLVELDPSASGPLLPSARQVRAAEVRPGQLVLVKPGEQVPLDGVIEWGTANLSLAHISGESHPVRMTVGEAVPAGSLNSDGLLVVRVTATADDSTPARIARMTAEAQVGGWWRLVCCILPLVEMGVGCMGCARVGRRCKWGCMGWMRTA